MLGEILMTVLDTVKGALSTAADTLSGVAQDFVEKNRTKARLNRLRMVMKNESELMNRAYIALGKEYYSVLKKGDAEPTEKQEKLLEVIDSCKAKIARARDCYREILESRNEFIYSAPAAKEEISSEDVVDITVACSNESDYNTSPFSEVKEAVTEKAEDIKEAAKEKAEDVKEAVAEKKKAVGKKAKEVNKAVKEALDEEFPEDELF